MFKTIYELLTGQNADPAYSTDVFPTVGLFTLIFSFIVSLIFYLLLGRWKPIWDKLAHWLITLVILALAAAFFAISQAKSATSEDADSFMYTFSMANGLYSIVYFFIFSLLLKRASIFAKRTPF